MKKQWQNPGTEKEAEEQRLYQAERRRARRKDFGLSLCFLSPSLLGVAVWWCIIP